MANEDNAKQVVEGIAEEIHGIYSEHAKKLGIEVPRWAEIPEDRRGLCYDLARFVVLKMANAYAEGQTAISTPKVDIPVTMPGTWTANEAKSVIAALLKAIEAAINRIAEVRGYVPRGPVEAGINGAIADVSKRLASEVFDENPELQSKLKDQIKDSLVSFFFREEEAEGEGADEA